MGERVVRVMTMFTLKDVELWDRAMMNPCDGGVLWCSRHS